MRISGRFALAFVLLGSALDMGGVASAAPLCRSASAEALRALSSQLASLDDDLTVDRLPVEARVHAAQTKLGAAAAPTDWQAVEAGLQARDAELAKGPMAAEVAYINQLKAAAERAGATADDAYHYAVRLRYKPFVHAASLRWLREAVQRDPHYFPAQKLLAEQLGSDAAVAKERAAAAEAYLTACPDEVDGYALVEDLAADGQVRWLTRLRALLPTLKGDELAEGYQTAWALAFKVLPVPAHPAVRAQIVKDLALLSALPPTTTILAARLKGAQLSAQDAATQAANADVERLFPRSSLAVDAALKADEHDFPEPHGDNPDAQRAHAKARIERFNRLLARWPYSQILLLEKYSDLSTVDAVSDLLATAKLLQGIPWYPVRNLVDPLLVHGVGTAFAASLLERAEELDRRQMGAELADADPATADKWARDLLPRNIRIDRRLTVLLRVRQKRVAEAAKLLVDVEALYAEGAKQTPELADAMKVVVNEARAAVAEAQGRKADALAFALAVHATDTDLSWVTEDAQSSAWSLDSATRLWRQLGGTAAGWDAMVGAAKKKTPVEPNSWSVAKAAAPTLGLTDLTGKAWTLEGLRGKTVFVNFWATWCGPCKLELPHLQALYDQMRNRKDVAFVAVSVDEDVGLVSGFVAEHKMTMPVLLGPTRFPEGGIPYNVIIDKTGKARFSLTGASDSGDWLATAKARLLEVAGP